MGRKRMTGNKISPIVRFHVDTEVQGILAELKAQGANISDFIRNSIKGNTSDKSDNQLVLKFCELFKETTDFIPLEKRNAFTDKLTDFEKQRIKALMTGGTA